MVFISDGNTENVLKKICINTCASFEFFKKSKLIEIIERAL